jgi:hypothetical protein
VNSISLCRLSDQAGSTFDVILRQFMVQVFFGALRRCKDLDLKGGVLLDGSVFQALAGTAAVLTALNCEDVGTVRFAA